MRFTTFTIAKHSRVKYEDIMEYLIIVHLRRFTHSTRLYMHSTYQHDLTFPLQLFCIERVLKSDFSFTNILNAKNIGHLRVNDYLKLPFITRILQVLIQTNLTVGWP